MTEKGDMKYLKQSFKKAEIKGYLYEIYREIIAI